MQYEKWAETVIDTRMNYNHSARQDEVSASLLSFESLLQQCYPETYAQYQQAIEASKLSQPVEL